MPKEIYDPEREKTPKIHPWKKLFDENKISLYDVIYFVERNFSQIELEKLKEMAEGIKDEHADYYVEVKAYLDKTER